MDIKRAVTPEDRHEMARMVKEIMGEKAELWWKTANPMFGGIAPIWLAVGQSERRVRNFIFDAYENNMASLKG